MRFTSIASGSSGNCTYIGSENTHFLVDAGISCKRIADSLNQLEIKPEELSGICITHEHSDHIQGLKIISKKYEIPIYGTRKTLKAIADGDKKGEINPQLYHPVDAGMEFAIGEFVILPFSNFHDAADPVGYRINHSHGSLAVVTDLGTYTQDTVNILQGINGILLEANHDVRMLETGSYPYSLKRRVLGDYGHLSNECSGQLLSRILNEHMGKVYLGHLSLENNFPELALQSVKNEVDFGNSSFHSKDFDISVAHRDILSPVVNIKIN